MFFLVLHTYIYIYIIILYICIYYIIYILYIYMFFHESIDHFLPPIYWRWFVCLTFGSSSSRPDWCRDKSGPVLVPMSLLGPQRSRTVAKSSAAEVISASHHVPQKFGCSPYNGIYPLVDYDMENQWTSPLFSIIYKWLIFLNYNVVPQFVN